MFTPSPQQQAVFDWAMNGRGNAFVEATAGSGKTTTLTQLCAKIVPTLRMPFNKIAFVAYNKKIAEEIAAKIAKFDAENGTNIRTRVDSGTFHSFGLRSWKGAYPDVKVDDRLKWDTVLESAEVPAEWHGFVKQIVSLAKQRGIGHFCPIEDTAAWDDIVNHFALGELLEDQDHLPKAVEASKVALMESIRIAPSLIDFDDMIYMPVVKNIKVWTYSWVLADEAQDTNPARRALARKMADPKYSRAVFVGDRHQAIYGFTGADADAVDRIISEFQCTRLPLTVSYRCPQSVIRAAQVFVPQISAMEGAPEGSVKTIEEAAIQTLELKPGRDAILCRKTAPLLMIAFRLIRRGIGCYVEGRDIGQGLVQITKMWKIKHTFAFLQKLDAWKTKQVDKLKKAKQDRAIETLTDRVDCIKFLSEGTTEIFQIQAKINDIFKDDGDKNQLVTLSTVHKSKGREWPNVYIFGKNLWMPSPMAKQSWELDQEKNIIYVSITRAKENLIFISAQVRS
jgi:DNA helicase II / ATP-dependent DNA helicase PcrA